MNSTALLLSLLAPASGDLPTPSVPFSVDNPAFADLPDVRLAQQRRGAALATKAALSVDRSNAMAAPAGSFVVPASSARLGSSNLPAGAMTVSSVGSGDLHITFNDSVLWEDSTDPNLQVLLNGSLTINPITLSVASSVLGTSTNLAELTALTRAACALELSATAGADYESDLDPILFPLPPIAVGGFSVVPVLSVGFGVSGEATANLVTSTVEQLAFEGGVGLGNGGFFGIPVAPQALVQFESPVFTQGTGAEGLLGVTAGIYFVVLSSSGVPIGVPFVGGAAGTQLFFQPTVDPWWDLDLNLAVNGGWYTQAFVPLFEQELYSDSFDLADAGGPFTPLYDPSASRWSRQVNAEDGIELLRDVAFAGNGDLLVVGDQDAAGARALVARLSSHGAPVWAKRADGLAQGGFPNVVFESEAGDLVVAGNRLTTGRPFVSRFDSLGNLTFARAIDLPETLGVLHETIELPGGDLVLAGSAQVNGILRPSAIRIDSSGNLVWAQAAELESAQAGAYRDVIRLADGRIALCGDTTYDSENDEVEFNAGLVTVLESNGTLVRHRVVGSPWVIEGVASLAETPGGGLVVAGHVDREDHVLWAFELDAAGDLSWTRTFWGDPTEGASFDGQFDRANEIRAVDGGYVVAATTGIGDGRDAQLFKLDERGRPVFWKSFAGVEADGLLALEVTDDNELLAGGFTKSVESQDGTTGVQNFWLVRTSIDGQLRFDEGTGMTCWNDELSFSSTDEVTALEPTGQLTALVPSVVPFAPVFVDVSLDTELLSL